MKILTWRWVEDPPKASDDTPGTSKKPSKPQRHREFFVKWMEVFCI